MCYRVFTNEPWGNGFCLKYGSKCDNSVLLVPSVKAKALIVISVPRPCRSKNLSLTQSQWECLSVARSVKKVPTRSHLIPMRPC